MPAKNVALVEARSGGMCEAGCGRAATNIHHRRFLARGGDHNVANLVHLDGVGNHNTGQCHGRAHQGDSPPGWSISRYEQRPEREVPFVDLGGRAWWFDDEGGKTDRPPTARKEKDDEHQGDELGMVG